MAAPPTLSARPDSNDGPAGLGIALWLHDPDAAALHDTIAASGAVIATPPFDGAFGTTFVFEDLDGYLVTVHDRGTRG